MPTNPTIAVELTFERSDRLDPRKIHSSSSFLCVQTCLKFSLSYFPAVPSAIPMLHWHSFALRMLFAVLLCAVALIIILA